MDASKYDRKVTLLCPTCGGTQFESDEDTAVQTVKCASCKLEITKDDLVRANEENVSEHIAEMGKELRDDLHREIVKAFSGNKYFKIR